MAGAVRGGDGGDARRSRAWRGRFGRSPRALCRRMGESLAGHLARRAVDGEQPADFCWAGPSVDIWEARVRVRGVSTCDDRNDRRLVPDRSASATRLLAVAQGQNSSTASRRGHVACISSGRSSCCGGHRRCHHAVVHQSAGGVVVRSLQSGIRPLCDRATDCVVQVISVFSDGRVF